MDMENALAVEFVCAGVAVAGHAVAVSLVNLKKVPELLYTKR